MNKYNSSVDKLHYSIGLNPTDYPELTLDDDDTDGKNEQVLTFPLCYFVTVELNCMVLLVTCIKTHGLGI